MATKVRRTTEEENATFSQVGAGTEMGEYLRCHWWAIGISDELKERPTFIRVLGEDLVLFRDGDGQPGLIGALCSHRRANLCLGIVEGNGLRCRYHGWKYDIKGNVIRTPGEPKDSTLKDNIDHLAYPVQELGGLIFAYLGPDPAPLLPNYDFLAGKGERYQAVIGFADCNWLQTVENGMDPYHASYTHATTWTDLDSGPDFLEFEETPYGIVYHAYLPTEQKGQYLRREHHLLLPGISVGAGGLLRGIAEGGKGGMDGGIKNLGKNARLPSSARFTTPIDDTHSIMMRVNWKPADSPFNFHRAPKPPASWFPIGVEPYREHKLARGKETVLGLDWPDVIGTQDSVVLESMLPVVDRDNENLSEIDMGIVMFRDLLLQGIDDVKSDRDPTGVFRDAAANQLHDITANEELLSRDAYENARARVTAA
jgi:5,5'-dehydrodivanillate O-demethylase